MTTRRPVQHLIANREVGMTECEQMVDYHELTDPTPWGMGRYAQGDVAIWDTDEYLSGYAQCDACHVAYNA